MIYSRDERALKGVVNSRSAHIYFGTLFRKFILRALIEYENRNKTASNSRLSYIVKTKKFDEKSQ